MPAARPRGRPTEGQRIAVRLPADVLAYLGDEARRRETSRAEVVRRLLRTAAEGGSTEGVDRAQIRRMLAMTPSERVRHMAAAANALAPFRGAVARR